MTVRLVAAAWCLMAAWAAVGARARRLPAAAPIDERSTAEDRRGDDRTGEDRREASNHEVHTTIDLLRTAAAAGLGPVEAVEAVTRFVAPPVREAFSRAARRQRRGAPTTDAFHAELVELGPGGAELAGLVADVVRDGSSFGEGLARLGAEHSSRTRRAAELESRRLPVRLLFPLVLCVLPAFALLSVVPLLAGSLDTIRL